MVLVKRDPNSGTPSTSGYDMLVTLPVWISAAAALVTAGVTRLVAPVWSFGPNGEGLTIDLQSLCANALGLVARPVSAKADSSAARSMLGPLRRGSVRGRELRSGRAGHTHQTSRDYSLGEIERGLPAAPPEERDLPWRPDYSSVKPSLSVTCQCATLPSTTWPRVSVTVNHWMLRTVSLALAIAVATASSMLVADEPVSSSILYT